MPLPLEDPMTITDTPRSLTVAEARDRMHEAHAAYRAAVAADHAAHATSQRESARRLGLAESTLRQLLDRAAEDAALAARESREI